MDKELFKIALVVENTEESVEYYTKLFGMVEHERLKTPGGDYVFLKSGPVLLELFPRALHQDCDPGFHHICFKTEDVQTTLDEVREKGAEVALETFDGGFGITLAEIKGPDNVRIRLFNRK